MTSISLRTAYALIALGAALTSCKSHPQEPGADLHADHAGSAPATAAATAALPPAQNAVQAEMRLLHEATRDWVSAIANNTLEAIPTGIHKVHQARTATEKALEKGEYELPKKGGTLDDFKKQDEEFHDELVALLKASKANDLAATTKQLGVVLEGCTSCHTKYRF